MLSECRRRIIFCQLYRRSPARRGNRIRPKSCCTHGFPPFSLNSELTMNKLFNTIVLACAATLSLSAMASLDDGNFLAQRHMKKGIQCAQCHSNNDVNKPVRKAECLTRHQSYEAMAKRTDGVDPNSHYNHYGDRDGSTCHKGHQQSVVSCNTCHKASLKTP